jgi:hypothetical protein
MKEFRIGLALLFLSSLTLRADGSSYSLDLNLSPTGQSGSYICRAEIKDLDTGKVLSAPSVSLMAGSPGTTKTTSGDLIAELQVSVDPKASRLWAPHAGPSGVPPNTRVQRTRPCASLRGSPLTRHPLGGMRAG